MTAERLRLVIFQETPGLWTAYGLEHSVTAQGHTVGEALRAVVRTIEAHTTFDRRHSHPPLVAFPPAPQAVWNAYHAGTAVPLSQLGVVAPPEWFITIAVTAPPAYKGTGHSAEGKGNSAQGKGQSAQGKGQAA